MMDLDGMGAVLSNADKIGVVAFCLILVLAFVREWIVVGRTVRRQQQQQETETRERIQREQKLADDRVAREREYASERLIREREITEQVRQSNNDILAANHEMVRQQDQLINAVGLVIDLVRALPAGHDVPQQREQSGG